MAPKFLCPVDGSDHALHAVDVAAELAQKYGAELLLCVVNVAHGGGRGPMIHHWTDEDAQAILTEAAKAATAKGITPSGTAVILDREAASGIVRFADMNGVDHIVADVTGRAHCSVTVAR